jgi:UDP-3-O-[3-hydroxymyristoyl] glucosamine N-acyltransferase
MISAFANVSTEARIGKNVTIGDFTVVHANVEIGDNSLIQEHCLLGVRGPNTSEPLRLGAGAHIRSHTVLYEHSRIGPGLDTGHHVVIRERSRIGENLRLGNNSDIEGDCEIGDFCRFHGYVHVGKGTHIGDFVWLFSLTTVTNDPLPPSDLTVPVSIGDGVVICVGTTLLPGCELGAGAFACAGAHVHGRVPIGAVVTGPQGRILFHVSRLMDIETGLNHPWMQHYRRVYPAHAQERLERLLERIQATRTEFRRVCVRKSMEQT